MARAATGELRRTAHGFAARITLEGRRRRDFDLVTCATEDDARARCTALAGLAARLRRAGLLGDVERVLELAAKAREGRPWQAILTAVTQMTAGSTSSRSEAERLTFRSFAEEWTSGRLHRRFPDHVPAKDAEQDKATLRRYVLGELGDLALVDIGLDDAERVMAALPERLGAASRRHVAQVMSRTLALAVYPARLLAKSPIPPRDWLPKLRAARGFTHLYPDEDRALLACTTVPLVRRLFFGVLAREGMRREELADLRFRDLDLERGLVRLVENKTDDPRSWALDPGVAEALRQWKKHRRAGATADERVFTSEIGGRLYVHHLARELRADLKAAGLTRPALFDRSPSRRPLRVHDLRATFVTVSLANGRSETWVADRTGHRSSEMINRYRRAARTWAETALGAFVPLASALPDLGSIPRAKPQTRTFHQGSDRANFSGEIGIRTLGTLASTLDFQSSTFGHSVISPELFRLWAGFYHGFPGL